MTVIQYELAHQENTYAKSLIINVYSKADFVLKLSKCCQ